MQGKQEVLNKMESELAKYRGLSLEQASQAGATLALMAILDVLFDLREQNMRIIEVLDRCEAALLRNSNL